MNIAKDYEQIVITPYSGMKAKYGLTAWGRLETMNELNEKKIKKFIKDYIGIDHHQ